MTMQQVELIESATVPTRQQIERLQSEMTGMEQVEIPTEHFFSGGMYCRRMTLKAGTLIVGKVHKSDHFFICNAGQMVAWTEDGMTTLNPGDVVESQSGTKRVILAITDAIGMNVHKTNLRDLDELEAELLEADETARFDSGNHIKPILITEN